MKKMMAALVALLMLTGSAAALSDEEIPVSDVPAASDQPAEITEGAGQPDEEEEPPQEESAETPADPADAEQTPQEAEGETPVTEPAGEPETPAGPETPREPETPGEPETSAGPETPPEPEIPGEPETPAEPEMPGEPVTPPVEEETRFTADFSIRVTPEVLRLGDQAELTLTGLESANMSFSIHWERTDLREDASRDEDRVWQEMNAYGRKLTLDVTEENASWGYRAVLIADNNEELISEMASLEPADAPLNGDETAPAEDDEQESATDDARDAEQEPLEDAVAPAETQDEPAGQPGTDESGTGSEKHTKTVKRIRRTVTQYVLAEKTEETQAADPSLYAEKIEGMEENPEFVLPENRSIDVTLTWDVEEPVLGDVAHFAAVLNGYDGLETALQWQISGDGETWTDIEGANGLTYDVEMVPQNYRHLWRVVVTILAPEKTEAEAAEETAEAGETADAAASAEEPAESEEPAEKASEDVSGGARTEEERKILKTVTGEEVLEVVEEAYDGDEDIEVTEVVEETVKVIEVADESEVPGDADAEKPAEGTDIADGAGEAAADADADTESADTGAEETESAEETQE